MSKYERKETLINTLPTSEPLPQTSINQYFLNIMWLWPDIMNLHGERGNLLAITKICEQCGIGSNVIRVTSLADSFDISQADIVLLGPGELAVLPGVIKALRSKIGDLNTYAQSGKVFFATGTAGAVLANKTLLKNGTEMQGLGLLDMECHERETVYGDDLIYRIAGDAFQNEPFQDVGTEADNDIFGIQIQMIDTTIGSNAKPFGSVIYGRGNNGEHAEGAYNDGIIFTNALGPVLVKNPWLTYSLINKAVQAKYSISNLIDKDGLSNLYRKWELERKSAEAIRIFNDMKEKPTNYA